MSRNGEDISDNAEWQLREELTVEIRELQNLVIAIT